MNPIVRNVMAVIVGFVAGCVINITLVNIGPSVVPLPPGADVTTMEGLRESMKLFTPANFSFPFLAHALGTLAGAVIAAKIAVSHRQKIAVSIGGLFLLGGIAMVNMVGGPVWFAILDLVAAYLPMGYLGAVLAGATRCKSNVATRALGSTNPS